jgi:hypothetical protein
VSAASAKGSRVRRRALEHLESILKKTAAGAALGLVACEGGCGPMVCDPLPPPLECTGDASTSAILEYISASAAWRSNEGDFVVGVTLGVHLYEANGSLVFSGDPDATGAVLSNVVRQDHQLQFYCTPDEGATEVVVVVPVACNGADEELVVTLQVDGEPAEGLSVPSTVE